MLQVYPQSKILLYIKAIDFRKGIDSLCAICRDELQQDLFTGTLFIFRNKPGTAIKVLVYDGQGFWLCQKRLSKGFFTHWPKKNIFSKQQNTEYLNPSQLQILLWNGDYKNIRCAPMWKQLP